MKSSHFVCKTWGYAHGFKKFWTTHFFKNYFQPYLYDEVCLTCAYLHIYMIVCIIIDYILVLVKNYLGEKAKNGKGLSPTC